MSRAAVRAFYMLLGGAVLAPPAPEPPGGECDPYVRPASQAIVTDLVAPLVVAPGEINTNLCSEIT